jgi:hypothetical protein
VRFQDNGGRASTRVPIAQSFSHKRSRHGIWVLDVTQDCGIKRWQRTHQSGNRVQRLFGIPSGFGDFECNLESRDAWLAVSGLQVPGCGPPKLSSQHGKIPMRVYAELLKMTGEVSTRGWAGTHSTLVDGQKQRCVWQMPQHPNNDVEMGGLWTAI